MKKYLCITNEGNILTCSKMPNKVMFASNIVINLEESKVMKNYYGCSEIKDIDEDKKISIIQTNTKEVVMKKKFTVKCSVDAGNIGVADVAYLERNGAVTSGEQEKELNRLGLLMNIEPGKYEFKIKIDDSWDDKVEGSGTIVTEGKIYIGDICYPFGSGVVEHPVWERFLGQTEFLKEGGKSMFIVNTGGDGTFNAIVEFTKVK